MCLVLYIGSDMDSPLIEPQDRSTVDYDDSAWPAKVTAFSVKELAGDEKAVVKHFNTKFVRYAGSFEGCGCGFNASYSPEWYEQAEKDDHVRAGRESRRLLRDYIETYNIRQIYACWNCDEGHDAVSSLDIVYSQITDPNFEFTQKCLLRITKS